MWLEVQRGRRMQEHVGGHRPTAQEYQQLLQKTGIPNHILAMPEQAPHSHGPVSVRPNNRAFVIQRFCVGVQQRSTAVTAGVLPVLPASSAVAKPSELG